MKKTLRVLATGLACCGVLLSSTLLAQPSFEWAKAMGGGRPFENEHGKAVKTDSDGNIYTIGAIQEGVVDFNPPLSVNTLDASAFRGYYMFILKTDSKGNFIWVKGIGNASASSIEIDNLDNIYISGAFTNTVELSSSISMTSNGNDDAFILKLDTAGNYIWAINWGGADYESARISLDKNGYIFCTTKFKGAVDFDPGPGVTTLSPHGGYDVAIVKFDTSGGFVWAKHVGGNRDDEPVAIGTDAWGNVYTTGLFRELADFDPGQDTHYLTAGGNSYFISKLDSAGNFVWAKDVTAKQNATDGVATLRFRSLVIDAFANVYTCGEFDIISGPGIDFDPGTGVSYLTSSNAFILKLDSAGNFVWVNGFGGSYASVYSINKDASGNIYSGGLFVNGTQNFDPGGSTPRYLDVANGRLFIAKFNALGSLVWAKNMGSSAAGGEINGTYVDASGSIYSTGSFMGKNIDFDPDPNVSFPLSVAGSGTSGSAIFIHKMNCPTVIATIATTECIGYDFFGETLKQSGTYTHTIPNTAGGCDSAIELTLTIPLIEAALTENEGTLTVNTAGATYQWIDCSNNTVISGETAQSFKPTADGKYSVIVALDGCSDTSDCVDFKIEEDVISIKELGAGNAIVLYPNPAEGQVHLRTGKDIQNATVTLFNITGQQLLQKQGLQGNRFSFDISTYAGGIYFMEIREQGSVARLILTIK